jgi:hypothetical protein
MEMKTRILPISAAIILVIGVVVFTVNKSNERTNVKSNAQYEAAIAPNGGSVPSETTVVLQSRDVSLKNGRLIIKEIEGKTWLYVNVPVMEEGPENKPYNVTLRKGSCASLPTVAYTLETLLMGSSETFLPMSLAKFKPLLPMSLVVQMPDPSTTIVSCGEITSIQ